MNLKNKTYISIISTLVMDFVLNAFDLSKFMTYKYMYTLSLLCIKTHFSLGILMLFHIISNTN